jgi:hypothetical protein
MASAEYAPVPRDEVKSLMQPDDFNPDDHDNTGMTVARKRLMQVGLCLNVACVYLGTGILAAFYPLSAVKHGLSQTQVGFVFGFVRDSSSTSIS